MSYTADYTPTDRTLVSVRGGLHEGQLLRHGREHVADLRVRNRRVSLPPNLLATCRRSTGSRRATATSRAFRSTDSRHHDRNFVDFSLTQMRSARPVQHQFKGGFGYSRAGNDVNLAYPNNGLRHRLLELRRSRATCLASGSGTRRIRLLHDRRHRHAWGRPAPTS